MIGIGGGRCGGCCRGGGGWGRCCLALHGAMWCWPFLEFMVVHWRCPCAGRHRFFFAGRAPKEVPLGDKKVGKRKRLKPPALKRVSWRGGGSGASGIRVLAHSALVTRQSFFRRRYARRRGTSLHSCGDVGPGLPAVPGPPAGLGSTGN